MTMLHVMCRLNIDENEAVFFSINCVWQGFKTHRTKLDKRIAFYLGSD